MRIFTGVFGSLMLAIFIACASFAAYASPLGTLQNSMLSVPAPGFSAGAMPGSNLLLSAVAPQSEQGGHVSLTKSLQWMRRYNYNSIPGWRSAAYASAVRSDGSLVVTGPSQEHSLRDDIVTICYATDGTPLWTNRFDGAGHGDDRSYYLAVRTNGDIWVVGQSMRYATNDTLTDVVTMRYASNGVPAWTNIYSSFVTNGAFPTGLLLDAAGNAYVLQTAADWQGFSGTTVEDAITKYDLAGNLVWTKHFTYGWDESLRFVANMGLDRSGELFVAGDSGSIFGNVLIKYDENGLPLYTNNISFPAATSVRFITPDVGSNLILTTESYAASNTPAAIMKRLEDGTVQWTNSVAGPNYNGGNVPQSAIDPAGNIFLIAGSAGAGPGLYQILKVNSDGVPLWTNLNANFGLTNSMISGSAVDSSGNLFLAGYASGTNGHLDCVLLKFSGNGQLVWSKPVGWRL